WPAYDCFFGLPRDRTVHSSPNRLAVSVTQLGSPKGRPRWTQQRNAATSASVCGWLTSCSQAVGERTGQPTPWYLGNVDGPRCHANQVVPATGLVDDAITTARKKGIVDQAGKPDLLPCRGNGFPAIRRRLTHGRVRYNSSCKNLTVSNSLQDLMPNPQGFLQVLADVPERSGPSGSSDCFVATFNANPAKGLRVIFQGHRGRGTQNALGRA